jgi:hypothetical protein
MKAFPHTYDQIIDGHVATCTNYGMDLRDWFAGLALPIIMPDNRGYPMDAARAAYKFADAMMKAREQ